MRTTGSKTFPEACHTEAAVENIDVTYVTNLVCV